MAETIRIEGWIKDPEPTEAAKLYKELSDAIWAKRSARANEILAVLDIVNPLEARDALNETVGAIDERFVISGLDRTVKLTGEYPSIKAQLSPELLANPLAFMIETYNLDKRYGKYRDIKVDGQGQPVKLLGGHRDYHRELRAQLWFGKDNALSSHITYSIKRSQPDQGKRGILDLTAWHNKTAIFGRTEGESQHSQALTAEQEISFLRTLQKLGGITIESPEPSPSV